MNARVPSNPATRCLRIFPNHATQAVQYSTDILVFAANLAAESPTHLVVYAASLVGASPRHGVVQAVGGGKPAEVFLTSGVFRAKIRVV